MRQLKLLAGVLGFALGYMALLGFAQTVSLLPNGMQQFADANGLPLASGNVYMFTPGTTSPKATYSDSSGTVQNPNPITLDAAGRAIIYGSGTYRQQVYDLSGNLIWDQPTSAGPTDGSITNAMLATMPDLTAKGNVSGGVASPSDLTATQITASLINDCTTSLPGRVPAPPNNPDTVLRGDCTWAVGASPGPLGRLTLVSGTPVMVSSQSAKTIVYYTCYNGHTAPVFNGTGLKQLAIPACEINMGLDAVTPRVASGSLYDVFGVESSSALALCIGPAWSTTASRGSGAGTTEIGYIAAGVWANVNSLTNCYGGAAGATNLGPISASRATYLGTFLASANGQTQFVFGASAASGTAGAFYLWNAYNRVPVGTMVLDSTASYTYGATVWRAANASNTMRVTYVYGLNEDPATAYYSVSSLVSGTGVGAAVGVAISATTTPLGLTGAQNVSLTITQDVTLAGKYQGYPGLGLNYLQAVEVLIGTPGTVTFKPGSPYGIGGLQADLRM